MAHHWDAVTEQDTEQLTMKMMNLVRLVVTVYYNKIVTIFRLN